MWLCFNDAFLSIVEHRDNPKILMVRARKREHLENFLEKGLFNQIYQVPASDYAWRVQLERDIVDQLVSERIWGINYDNFKNSVKDKELKSFYEKVWLYGMMILQKGYNLFEDYTTPRHL